MLLHSRNNIPANLIGLRRNICTELKLDDQDLPFAGELMQVRSEELDWQPALEKLLNPLALRLLVPDKHYKKVTRYINNTDLKTRLVYNLVKDVALQQHADKGTAWHKLEFHPEHPLSAWVGQQVIQQYNFSCVDNEKSLERYEKAITIQGLIKNRDRHEKDDRPGRSDASRYVLGWNNEKKKEALQRRRSQLLTELEQADEARQRVTQKGNRLRDQVFAAKHIGEHDSFRTIHIAALQQAIHHAEEQMSKLKKGSDQLKALTQQLEGIREKLQLQQKEKDELVKKTTLVEFDLQTREKEQQNLSGFVNLLTETDKDLLLQFQQRHSSALSAESLSLDNIDTHYSQLTETAELAAKQYEETAAKEGRELDRAINKIKNPPLEVLQRFTDWAADTQRLPADREYAGEYMEWLDKLESENLPRFKKDFERLLHDTAVIKMGVLNEELESWERKIKNSISTLNQSLSGINFNRLPDTYIQLGIRPVTDTVIKESGTSCSMRSHRPPTGNRTALRTRPCTLRRMYRPLSIASMKANPIVAGSLTFATGSSSGPTKNSAKHRSSKKPTAKWASSPAEKKHSLPIRSFAAPSPISSASPAKDEIRKACVSSPSTKVLAIRMKKRLLT